MSLLDGVFDRTSLKLFASHLLVPLESLRDCTPICIVDVEVDEAKVDGDGGEEGGVSSMPHEEELLPHES
jgi:hypothetical protein